MKLDIAAAALVAASVLSPLAHAGDSAGRLNIAASPATRADIVDTAVQAGQFSTLAKALTAAGLIDTLKGPGPFTVFAPTDEAFARIPPEQLSALLADKAALTKVLTYHVVPGSIPAARVKSGPVKTVQGQSLELDASASGVRVNEARVVKADVLASNGVIHVIDRVVMPR